MASEGLGEMFEGDFADMCAKKSSTHFDKGLSAQIQERGPRTPHTISERYDNSFWEKNNYGGKREREKMPSGVIAEVQTISQIDLCHMRHLT